MREVLRTGGYRRFSPGDLVYGHPCIETVTVLPLQYVFQHDYPPPLEHKGLRWLGWIHSVSPLTVWLHVQGREVPLRLERPFYLRDVAGRFHELYEDEFELVLTYQPAYRGPWLRLRSTRKEHEVRAVLVECAERDKHSEAGLCLMLRYCFDGQLKTYSLRDKTWPLQR